MRRTLFSIATVAFLSGVVILVYGVAKAIAQEETPPAPTVTPPAPFEEIYRVPVIRWEPPTVDLNGDPLRDLAGYIIRIVPAGVELAAAETPLERQVNDPRADKLIDHTIAELLGLGEWDVYVAAFNTAGIVSPFAKSAIPMRIADTPPAAPGRLTVEVRIVRETVIQAPAEE